MDLFQFIIYTVFAFMLSCNGFPSDPIVGRTYDRKTFKEIPAPSRAHQADVPSETVVKGPVNSKGSDPSSGAIQDYLGPGVKLDNYDTDIFDFRGGGPVQFIDELSTDFGSSNCWNNYKSNNFPWKKATGAPSAKKIQQLFGTSTGPDDDYLVAFSNKPRKPSDASIFESCSISCVASDVQFSIKYWASSGVNLKVCTREVFFDDEPPGNCQKLPTEQQPGPATLVFKKLKNLSAIDIVADNFVDEKGGIAIIDDIKVIYTPCGDNKSTTGNPLVTKQPGLITPSVPSGEADSPVTCQNVVCPFQHDLCNYKDFQELGKPGAKKFSLETGRYHNRLTGIRGGPSVGKKYAAAYLLRHESAGLASGPVELSADRLLEFSYYIATQNNVIQVCFDSELKCAYTVGGDVQPDSRQWKTAAVTVPKQTKQVFIISRNNGVNEGAVGVTDIKWLVPDFPGSTTGSVNACPNTGEPVLRDTESQSQANPSLSAGKLLPSRKSPRPRK